MEVRERNINAQKLTKFWIFLVDTYIDGQDPKLEETLIAENGHNVLVSDMISLDRSVPDFRNEEWV